MLLMYEPPRVITDIPRLCLPSPVEVLRDPDVLFLLWLIVHDWSERRAHRLIMLAEPDTEDQ